MEYEEKKFSIEAGILKGRELPQWYLDEPPLEPEDFFYIQAFQDLNTTRALGFSVGPIPWNRITEYADRIGLESDVAGGFALVIRTMDAAYTDWAQKQAKKKPIT